MLCESLWCCHQCTALYQLLRRCIALRCNASVFLCCQRAHHRLLFLHCFLPSASCLMFVLHVVLRCAVQNHGLQSGSKTGGADSGARIWLSCFALNALLPSAIVFNGTMGGLIVRQTLSITGAAHCFALALPSTLWLLVE